MSSGVGYVYRAAETPAQIEARLLASATTELEVARSEWRALQEECADFVATYGVSLRVDSASQAGALKSSDQVKAAARALVVHTEGQRQRLDRARVAQRNASLRQRLGELADDDPPDVDVPAAGAKAGTKRPAETTGSSPVRPAEPMTKRVARYLAALDPEVALSDEVLARARSVAALERDDRGQMLARSFQAEIGLLNAAARRRRAGLTQLRELDVRCEPLGPDGAAARVLVRRALKVAEDGGPVSLEAPTARVEAAERAVAAEVVMAKVAAAFQGTGYEPVIGFETMVPQGGVLVRQPGWDGHAVLAQVDGKEITFDVVRTAVGSDKAQAHAEDLDVESQFCGHVPTLREQLKAAGLDERGVEQPPAGVMPIRTLDGAPPVPDLSPVVRQAKLRERKL